VVELRDTRVPATPCPYCGHHLDGAMASDPKTPDATPKDGDLCVCINCAQILVFNADLTGRAATAAELRELRLDKPLADHIAKVQRFVRGLDRRKPQEKS